MEHVLDQVGEEMEALRKIGVGLELEFGLFRPRGLSVLHRVSVRPESWTWWPQATALLLFSGHFPCSVSFRLHNNPTRERGVIPTSPMEKPKGPREGGSGLPSERQ